MPHAQARAQGCIQPLPSSWPKRGRERQGAPTPPAACCQLFELPPIWELADRAATALRFVLRRKFPLPRTRKRAPGGATRKQSGWECFRLRTTRSAFATRGERKRRLPQREKLVTVYVFLAARIPSVPHEIRKLSPVFPGQPPTTAADCVTNFVFARNRRGPTPPAKK